MNQGHYLMIGTICTALFGAFGYLVGITDKLKGEQSKLKDDQAKLEKDNAVTAAVMAKTSEDIHNLLKYVIDSSNQRFENHEIKINGLEAQVNLLNREPKTEQKRKVVKR